MALKRRGKEYTCKTSQDGINAGQIIWLFFWISVYRLINAWVIRTQFDPDEYWQTLEPAYCLVFGSADRGGSSVSHSKNEGENTHLLDKQRVHGCALTWEWTRRWSPASSSYAAMEYTSSSSYTSITRIIQTLQTIIDQALHGPVRSYVAIFPTYCYYLACRSLFNWASDDKNTNDDESSDFLSQLKQFIRQHSTYIISKGPAFLHAVLVAAPTDLSVWLIASRMNSLKSLPASNHDEIRVSNECHYAQSWQFWALVCSITSWFHGYALVRTYANSVETVCLLVGITLLGPDLFGQSSSSWLISGGKHGRPQRAMFAFVLGGLSACVRFTSLAAWIPIGLIISFRSGKSSGPSGTKKNSYSTMMTTLLGFCLPFGFIGVLVGCCIDRWFYGFWAIPFLGNIHFNVLLGHGSLYGTHPFLWYAYAGIPAICGILLPFFLWNISTINSSPRSVLLGIISPYIALHSFSEHKEFRFLLPVLPLICIFAGHALCLLVRSVDKPTSNSGNAANGSRENKATPKSLILILILLNYPHLFYLGVIHQRGPIAVNEYLSTAINEETLQVSQSNEIREYSIHYLTGCHSAPVYSHLHTPNVRVSAWHLDCSPDCRSYPGRVCESDSFLKDPLGFVISTYGYSVDGDRMEVDTVKVPPSFLIAMHDDAVVIESALIEKMKMSHVASIRHTIKSLSWRDRAPRNDSDHEKCPSHERYHGIVTLFSIIDIHFDHIEVYATSY
ncbi:hypothetical protein ACHAW5_009886 [Stephanodiscus triporus]|uniref:Mannosyltransferase n=1 Tax=Stephanodiscus triporus TaxID=2934178 RepID=A0ABD3Q3W9_9STRA